MSPPFCLTLICETSGPYRPLLRPPAASSPPRSAAATPPTARARQTLQADAPHVLFGISGSMNWYSRPTGVQVLDVVFAQADGQRANVFHGSAPRCASRIEERSTASVRGAKPARPGRASPLAGRRFSATDRRAADWRRAPPERSAG